MLARLTFKTIVMVGLLSSVSWGAPSASPPPEDCLGILRDDGAVRVKRGATFAFLRPTGGRDGRQLTELLTERLHQYRFIFFENQNIIAMIDNWGDAHILMWQALFSCGFINPRTPSQSPLAIMGGTRLHPEYDIVIASTDLGDALKIHFQVFKNLEVEKRENLRDAQGQYVVSYRDPQGGLTYKTERVGFQQYQWILHRTLIKGIPKKIVQ